MKATYTAIIIDDEERARRTLRLLLDNFCPNVNVLEVCESVPDGVLAINKKNPDIVFLDIEMPKYNGFELLGFFKEITFEIIFITAYNQYALKAFEVSAVDYLLKPIDGDLLAKAVEKAAKRMGTTQMHEQLKALQQNTETDTLRRIALSVSDGLLLVEVDEILFIEAQGAYASVNLMNKEVILVSKRLNYFEELLNNRPNFFRCHRSFLVNLNQVKKLNRNEGYIELDNGKKISFSRDKKTELEQLLKGS